jgi:hypothetical protein
MRVTNRASFLIASVTVSLLGCYSMARSGHLGSAERALAENNCSRALASVGSAESMGDVTDGERLHIAFIRAQCYDRMSRTDDALGLYDYVAEKDPDSPRGFQSRQRAQGIRAERERRR